MGVTPVTHVTHAGIQGSGARVMTMQPLMQGDIFCPYNAHSNRAMQPDNTLLLVHLTLIYNNVLHVKLASHSVSSFLSSRPSVSFSMRPELIAEDLLCMHHHKIQQTPT